VITLSGDEHSSRLDERFFTTTTTTTTITNTHARHTFSVLSPDDISAERFV